MAATGWMVWKIKPIEDGLEIQERLKSSLGLQKEKGITVYFRHL